MTKIELGKQIRKWKVEQKMKENVWVNSYMDLREYPIGTKAKALGGGYWTRIDLGWRWGDNGGVFPSVGGDWSGKVCLPLIDLKKDRS